MQRVRVVSIAMTAWGDQHGAFPATEEELQAALKQYARLASVIEESPSLFARKGQRIPYRTVLVPAAKGPHQPTPPGDQPGIVYCAVSSDLRRAWFTATVLDELVGGAIVFMEFEPGLRWLEEKLPEPAPK